MGLLTSYGDSNRVVNNGLQITYSMRMVKGAWETVGGPVQVTSLVRTIAYEYHRYASKSYEYVGMDYDTAVQCQSDMVALYTRSFKTSEYYNQQWTDVTQGSMLMADISIQKTEGCMYKVIVNVREDDSRIRFTAVSPETLFTDENTRDYEEPSNGGE